MAAFKNDLYNENLTPDHDRRAEPFAGRDPAGNDPQLRLRTQENDHEHNALPPRCWRRRWLLAGAAAHRTTPFRRLRCSCPSATDTAVQTQQKDRITEQFTLEKTIQLYEGAAHRS